jgi:FlaA1/EpsC-like NDP-sugar epimerase/lipopolysaccharide/colanic/teichoic acid biosynthesis glycosyltransferase
MQEVISTPTYQKAGTTGERSLLRLCDLLMATAALIVLAPSFLIVALIIKLTSPGPIFYKASRVGRGGELFLLYKFRTMVTDADRQGPGITVQDDPRVTRVGRFLRRHKLDELPQLINILRGEMSVVGPRPEDPRYVALYSDSQRRLLDYRPGLTSPASIFYSREEALLSGEDWETVYREQILPHKLALDLKFMRQYTLGTYFSLIFLTAVTVLGMPRILQRILAMRNRHLFAIDLFLLSFTPAVALALREEVWGWHVLTEQSLLIYTLLALVVKLSAFYHFGLYDRYWRYAGLLEMPWLAVAVGVATGILTGLVLILQDGLAPVDLAVPRTLPLIDGLLTALAVTLPRYGLRFLHEWHRRHYPPVNGAKKALIVGAGHTGAMALDEIRANGDLDLDVIGFVDDDPNKIGGWIQGVPVLGPCATLEHLVGRYGIQRVVIAMPTASQARRAEIEASCRAAGVEAETLPGLYELIGGYKTVTPVPKVDFHQLLRRQEVVVEQSKVSRLIQGQVVLVTGAGGSIGSELCRQIARCEPAEIVLLGHGENSIFEIALNLRLTYPELKLHQVIADVRDQKRIDQLVALYRPKIIYHAAAHKHVPLMQASVEEAVTNNVEGTWNVLRAAEAHGIEHFVLISSDKAINPKSIMGATKRLAELLVQAAARRSGRAYVAVRFGNVLGSRGSVIPLFQRQIAAGGPLTVTHPEMTRYFMTIPEAVRLVLQATVLGDGGEIFVLDMGNPVRILDLVDGLIALAGMKKQRDIEIVFSGVRPGEKLSEELFQATEEYGRTSHEKIFVARERVQVGDEQIEEAIAHLIKLAHELETGALLAEIKTILPGFVYQERVKIY